MDNYQQRSHELARRFLQTAIVVDDRAYSEQDNGPKGQVVEPSRIQTASGQNDQDPAGRGSRHSLDAGPIINSFSELGIICGVVSPADSAPETMRKADIVVLDWFLRDGNPQYTLTLLGHLLAGESDRNSLRLVSIYTGEAKLDEICETIVNTLTNAKLDPKPNEARTKISYQHGCVVLYAKSGVNLAEALQDRSIEERDLPEKLVEDFASMTSGLLPAIALTSLAAVREGAHKVLDRFSSDLDPAFLAHRACLPNPDDAEQQIVDNVADELRGLMDNAVAKASPTGAEAVECWMRDRYNEDKTFTLNQEDLNLEEITQLMSQGLIADGVSDSKINKYIEDLSKILSVNNDAGLDERLTWITSFRMMYDAPPPTLRLGSVVTELSDERERHLICMRPRCDCVRLKKETSFFFLALVKVERQTNNSKKSTEKLKGQIIVKLDNGFEYLGIKFDSAGWVCQQFQPSTEKDTIMATQRDDGHFEFIDIHNNRYIWRGELKPEYAQRIAQNFGTELSRVAVDESEWLRRMSKKMIEKIDF